MSDHPSLPPARFSPGRVLSVVGYVVLAAGVFAAIWFIPWPAPQKKPPPSSLPMREHFDQMRKIAERQAAERRVADGESEK